MSTVPFCPKCGTPHQFESAQPGTLLICEVCQEVFEASGSEAHPSEAESPADHKVDPTTPEVRPAPDREQPDHRAALILLATCVAGFLAVLVIGLSIGYVAREREQAAQARAEAAEQEAEEARRASELERLRMEAALAAAREKIKPADPEPTRLPKSDPAPPITPVAPPKPPDSGVLKFDAPANPFKPGTQTRLRLLRSVALPDFSEVPERWQPSQQPKRLERYFRVAHSPRHQVLFVLNSRGIWVYDLKASKEIGMHEAKEIFTDMSLSPDQSALYAAEFGGTSFTGNGTPRTPSRVHRFDLAKRTWEARTAPKIAYKIEAVDAGRVLLLESSQWVDVTLNRWEWDGVGVRELSRFRTDYGGDIEYDPRNGRIYHGNDSPSTPRITVRFVDGNELEAFDDISRAGPVLKGGGGSIVLSQDGSRLYFGPIQVSPRDTDKPLQNLPEVIIAASRDIAFGAKAYYRATTGAKLGEFDERPAAIAVSPDGLSVWVLDRGNNIVRQYALEGEK